MAMAGISANRLELLQIADAVAREKSIDKSVVLHAMEEAITKAGGAVTILALPHKGVRPAAKGSQFTNR